MKNKVICLISGGIDSPVAATMMSKKFEIIPLHFSLYPYYCYGSVNRVIKIFKHLKTKLKFRKIIIFPWGEILAKISRCENKKYQCILCRKSMFKVAERIAKKEKAFAIVTGESLAQKASQTLQNLAVTSSEISVPILRPLLGFDKVEIEQMSKKLGIWSERHVGCCSVTPKYPVTRADLNIANNLYKELNLNKLIERQLKKAKELKSLDDSKKYFIKF